MSLQRLAARQRIHLRFSRQRSLSKRHPRWWPIITTASLCDRPNTSTARQDWLGKASFLSRKSAFKRQTKARLTDSNLRPWSQKPLYPPQSHQIIRFVPDHMVEAWNSNPLWINTISLSNHIKANWMPQSDDKTRWSTQVITNRSSKWFKKKFNGKAEMRDVQTIRSEEAASRPINCLKCRLSIVQSFKKTKCLLSMSNSQMTWTVPLISSWSCNTITTSPKSSRKHLKQSQKQ